METIMEQAKAELQATVAGASFPGPEVEALPQRTATAPPTISATSTPGPAAADSAARDAQEDIELVKSASAFLERQLEIARNDLETIQRLKKEALENPKEFVTKVTSGKWTGMPKLQKIIAVPNIDNFNSGKEDPAKLFPGRPSVLPLSVYEVTSAPENPDTKIPVTRPVSAPPTQQAFSQYGRNSTAYLDEYMTLDTANLVNQNISLERPTSALSSPASSPPDSQCTSKPHGAGKTSRRLLSKNHPTPLRRDSDGSFGSRSSSGDGSTGRRTSSRRSTSEYSRVGRAAVESENVKSPASSSYATARPKRKRRSVNFEDGANADDSDVLAKQADGSAEYNDPKTTSAGADDDDDVKQPQPKRKKVHTPGIPWSEEEIAKLDLLLIKYPETKVQSHRHQQIADELGTRSLRQVASKLQKYLPKKALAGAATAASPGAGSFMVYENDNLAAAANSEQSTNTTTIARNRVSGSGLVRHATVMMKSSRRGRGRRSGSTSSSQGKFQTMPKEDGIDAEPEEDTDDDVDEEVKASDEYKELSRLKKLLKQREKIEAAVKVVHHGYKCDGCGSEPILGVRVSCKDCPELDLCGECADSGYETETHDPKTHEMERNASAEAVSATAASTRAQDPAGGEFSYLGL